LARTLVTACGKYLAELAKEMANQTFGAPSAAAAETSLQACAASLEDSTDRVFRALNPGG